MASQPVAVVTGGGDPRALATARLLARDHHVVLSDARREPLHRALDQLDSADVSAESIVADPTDRHAMDLLLAAAREAGPVATVVHAARGEGDSPAEIVRARVLGTVNVTAATLAVAGLGTTLVHAVPVRPVGPSALVPRWMLRLASTDPEALVRGLTRLADLGPARWAPAMAHGLGDTFVHWYTGHMAGVFAARGASLRSTGEAALGGGDDLARGDHGLLAS